MAIQPLPPSTVRLLGSSMNIATPCDLVKELLDNALDAQATVVEITISSNTIDRISVKDNGSGIDIDDFSALGRRAHTSKLREYNELVNMGGTTLGFRGEALASVNSIANVTIITKRTGDPIAWRIELVPGTGGVKNKRPVSSTVGTTVAVTRLFEILPPRRQFALKEARKCISQIQQLLRQYVFARPNIKMSLKIIGDNKPLWTYSPRPPDLKREAILQIFGANGMTNCIEVYEEIYLSRESTIPMETQAPAQWVFSGYIPKPHSICKDSRVRGAHLSVDSRPMSAGWHVTKKMTSILKSHISQVTEPNFAEGHSGVFLQINIRCPPCSYDPNITMRKDELLLFEEKSLLNGFELVCKRAYEKHGQALAASQTPKTPRTQPNAAPGRKGQFITEDEHEISCNFTGRASCQHDNLDNPQALHDVSEATRPKIKTIMKTTFEVNMGRKEDSDSGEENTDTAVEVEIPPGPPSLLHSHTSNQEQHPCQTKNIRHYFQSLPKDDFIIACDSTATTGIQVGGSIGHQLDDYSPSNRTPLQPLSDIALNRIREEAESSPEPPGSDSILPGQIINATSGDITSPSFRRSANTTHHLATQGLERAAPSLYHAGLNSQETEDEEGLSPSDSISLRMLTPPPSDPTYRHQQANPQSRPRPQLNNLSCLRTNIAQQKHNGIRRDFRLQGGSKQEIPPSGTNNISYGSATGTVGVFGPSKVHPRRAAVPRLPNENPYHILLGQKCGNSNEIPRNGLASFLSSGLSPSQPPELTQSYIRRTALSLFNSPELENQLVHTSSSDENNDGDEGHQEIDHSIKTLGEREPRAQRFPNHYGQVRRMSTDRLPFESIDASRQTFGLSTVLCQRVEQIQDQMNHHSTLEAYIMHGNLRMSLPFRNLSDTQCVQRELQLVVRSWVKRTDIPVHVEYTLESSAKGKCRAE